MIKANFLQKKSGETHLNPTLHPMENLQGQVTLTEDSEDALKL